MDITRGNYESIFLDYYEGNLSAENTAALFIFLEQHPDLKKEFEEFELVLLPATPIDTIFPDKKDLKKITVPTVSNIQEWLIAESENDLTLQQRVQLSSFLQLHPEFARDRDLYLKSKLIVDRQEVYADKSSLKKRVIVPIIIPRFWYAAAALILLLGAWFILQKQKNESGIAPMQQATNTVIAPQVPVITNVTGENQKANQEERVQVPAKNENKQVATNLSASDEHKNAPQNRHPKKNAVAAPLQYQGTMASTTPGTIVNTPQNLTNTQVDVMPMPTTPLTIAFAEETEVLYLATDLKSLKANAKAKENGVNEKVAPATLLADVTDRTASTLNQLTGRQVFPSTEKITSVPLKSRVIRFAALLVGIVSNNQVKVKTAFDPINGNLAAYEVEMGKNKWQKQF